MWDMSDSQDAATNPVLTILSSFSWLAWLVSPFPPSSARDGIGVNAFQPAARRAGARAGSQTHANASSVSAGSRLWFQPLRREQEKMKLIGAVIILLTLTSASLAKKAEKREKKSDPVYTNNTLKAKGKSISFTCSPTNCREQQDGSFLFNLSCQTNKEGDKLEISVGDKSQTVQSFGFIDIPGDLKAPKKGSVPMKISVSEDPDSPPTTFTFKYTVDQIKRPTCRNYGDVEL
jgi:hypothetical protein